MLLGKPVGKCWEQRLHSLKMSKRKLIFNLKESHERKLSRLEPTQISNILFIYIDVKGNN